VFLVFISFCLVFCECYENNINSFSTLFPSGFFSDIIRRVMFLHQWEYLGYFFISSFDIITREYRYSWGIYFFTFDMFMFVLILFNIFFCYWHITNNYLPHATSTLHVRILLHPLGVFAGAALSVLSCTLLGLYTSA